MRCRRPWTTRPAVIAAGALLAAAASACATQAAVSPTSAVTITAPPAVAVNHTESATATASSPFVAVAFVTEVPVEAAPLTEEPNRPCDEDVSDEEIVGLIESSPETLGSLSLGRPNAGALMNAIPMPEGDGWEIIDPRRSWATQETVDYLTHAIQAVDAEFERTHPLYVGHLSYERGGPMRPHLSHQSGRDVDLSYYYLPDRNPGWYQKASERTLDKAKTWALVRALVVDADVEYIFMNKSVQKLVKEYALSQGEDAQWLDRIFQYRSREIEPIVRAAYGHATHMHVRFYNPRAQKLGVRTYDLLADAKLIKRGHYFTRYRVQDGDSIALLAERFRTTPRSIRSINNVKSLDLQPGKLYYIPTRGRVSRVDVVEIPERRLPPPPRSSRMHGIAAPESGQ